jgi:hypothetical protein
VDSSSKQLEEANAKATEANAELARLQAII